MGIDSVMVVKLTDPSVHIQKIDFEKLSQKLESECGATMELVPTLTKKDLFKSFSFGPDVTGQDNPANRGTKLNEWVERHCRELGGLPRQVWMGQFDGPPLPAKDGEQLVDVCLHTRYFDEDYERGDWPMIESTIEWLLKNLGSESYPPIIMYGGDSSGKKLFVLDETHRMFLSNLYEDTAGALCGTEGALCDTEGALRGTEGALCGTAGSCSKEFGTEKGPGKDFFESFSKRSGINKCKKLMPSEPWRTVFITLAVILGISLFLSHYTPAKFFGVFSFLLSWTFFSCCARR